MSHLFKSDYSIYSETVKRDYFLPSTLKYSVLSLTAVRETRELLPYATYFRDLTTNTGGFLILKFLMNFLWFTPLFTFFSIFTYFRQRLCLQEVCFMRLTFEVLIRKQAIAWFTLCLWKMFDLLKFHDIKGELRFD